MSDTLLTVWQAQVADTPAARALVDAQGREWSRAELDALASRLAQTLPTAVSRQRVAFALANSAEWFATFLGLLRAGATPVALDPSEPIAQQRTLAGAAGATFILIDNQAEQLGAPIKRRQPVPALIKLTSGSTGLPRALAFTHANMLADGRQVCASMDIRPDDLNLAVIPFGHSYGLGNLVVPLLMQGTALVCADLPLPHALAELSARYQPTVFPAVPALLRVLAAADLPAQSFASVRTVISAGAPLSAEVAASFFSKYTIKPHGFYGSSETGGITYDRTGDETLAGRSVGTALNGVTLTPAKGGRLRVSSAAALRGSWLPADKARIEPDGRVVLLGRSGRMIKIGGRRLDLTELEASLRALPDVHDAFAAPHPDDPEQLAAVIATPLAPLPLRALLRSHLATWKIPRRLVPVPAFPLTARGKPDTAALRKLLAK